MKKYLTIMVLVCSTNAFGETDLEIVGHAAKETMRKVFEEQ